MDPDPNPDSPGFEIISKVGYGSIINFGFGSESKLKFSLQLTNTKQ
jgi:hypothetical protein